MTHLEAFVYRRALTPGIRRLLAIVRNTSIHGWAIAPSDGRTSHGESGRGS
jgi:hypothetical protein